MYRGKTNQVAKVWSSVGGVQISEIPQGATVTGDAPSGGYAYLYPGSYNGKAWKGGVTKTSFLTGYALVVTTPTDPPVTGTLPDVLYIATKADMSDRVEYKKAA